MNRKKTRFLRPRSKIVVKICHFNFRRQPAEFFISKIFCQPQAGQNNKYDIAKSQVNLPASPADPHSATFDEKVYKPQSWCDCDRRGSDLIGVSTSHMNECIIILGVRGTPGDLYECIKPINFKIGDIEPKGRFVNLIGDFSTLCGPARLNCIPCM